MGEKGRAPVQSSRNPGSVPWDMHVRAWQVYRALGHEQSAERIAERRGFDWVELAVLLDERNPFIAGYPRLTNAQRARLARLREPPRV